MLLIQKKHAQSDTSGVIRQFRFLSDEHELISFGNDNNVFGIFWVPEEGNTADSPNPLGTRPGQRMSTHGIRRIGSIAYF